MVWEPCEKEPTLCRASCLQYRGDASGVTSLEHCSDRHYRDNPLWPVLPRDGHRLTLRSKFLSFCGPGFATGLADLADLAVYLDSEKMEGRPHPCPVTCGDWSETLSEDVHGVRCCRFGSGSSFFSLFHLTLTLHGFFFFYFIPYL